MGNAQTKPADIQVITESPTIEKYLQQYKEVIGGDYEGYRGHLYRVLSYTLHFLGEEEASKYRDVIEVALVFHDIGLWTDGELNYLEPSFEVAQKKVSDEFNEEMIQLIHDIIRYHHKVTQYTKGAHAHVVDAVRKGDWIDATQGMIKNGMSKANIEKVNNEIAVNGFYDTLKGFGPRLHGNNWFKIVRELSQIYYW